MTQPNGMHHVALMTGNMKGQIEFFSDVLGMPLVALYPMHGVEGAMHGFVKLNDTCYLAFVQSLGSAQIKPAIGVSHGEPGTFDSAPGTLQHLSLNVDTEAELLAMRDRIRLRGVTVFGPVNHGMCQSIYFCGPENLWLEVATSEAAIDARAWIDPEVVKRVGISEEELVRNKNPPQVEDLAGAAKQPPYNPVYHSSHWDKDVFMQLTSAPDEQVTAILSQPEPPVKITV